MSEQIEAAEVCIGVYVAPSLAAEVRDVIEHGLLDVGLTARVEGGYGPDTPVTAGATVTEWGVMRDQATAMHDHQSVTN